MRHIKSLTLLNAFSFIIQAGLFYSVHFQLINRNVVREITIPYYSLLIPTAGISFIAWGVMYTALTIFCLYHFKMAFTHREKYPANQDIRRVDMFFIINNLASAGWVLTTINGQMIASLILLGFQLTQLAIIHHHLGIHRRFRRLRSTVCTQVPLTIYAAWLSVIFLGGISEYFKLNTGYWNHILLATLVFISLLMIFFRHNILFGLMMIPALYSIILNADAIVVEDPKSIILEAWAGIWIVGLASLVKLVADFRLKEPPVVYHRTVYD